MAFFLTDKLFTQDGIIQLNVLSPSEPIILDFLIVVVRMLTVVLLGLIIYEEKWMVKKQNPSKRIYYAGKSGKSLSSTS